jgi:hypothetical protein
MVTRYPELWSNLPMLEEIIPFPREETTPPVTKIKKVPDIFL